MPRLQVRLAITYLRRIPLFDEFTLVFSSLNEEFTKRELILLLDLVVRRSDVRASPV